MDDLHHILRSQVEWRSFFSKFYCTINAFKVCSFYVVMILHICIMYMYSFQKPLPENYTKIFTVSISYIPQQAIYECILCKHNIENVMNCIYHRVKYHERASLKTNIWYLTDFPFNLAMLVRLIFKYHSLYFESNIVMALELHPSHCRKGPAGILRAGVNCILG